MLKKGLNIIDDFLPLDLAEELLKEFKDKKSCDLTNSKHWDKDILEDSKIILINQIKGPLADSLISRVNSEFDSNFDWSTLFYRWTTGSYIPPHLDYGIDHACTIHLNKDYNPKYGGMFLFKEEQNDHHWIGIEPIFNRAVIADTKGEPDIWHQVTPVVSKFDRMSIQMFW
jgi:Rps23 Pro-64 3,4-dihydroxylase Tpa1-like proline 4-hydroxylase